MVSKSLNRAVVGKNWDSEQLLEWSLRVKCKGKCSGLSFRFIAGGTGAQAAQQSGNQGGSTGDRVDEGPTFTQDRVQELLNKYSQNQRRGGIGVRPMDSSLRRIWLVQKD